MKVIIKYLLTGVLLWTTVQGHAQSKQAYYKMLQNFMHDLKKVQFPVTGHYLMHMHIKMVPKMSTGLRQKSLEVKEARVKMIVGAQKMMYETGQVSIYQDQHNIFQVFHPQKLILQKEAPKDIFGQHRKFAQSMTKMQEELFAQSQVVSVKDVNFQGKAVKEIVMLLTTQAQQKFRVKTVTYIFDVQKKYLEKQIVKFTQAHPLASQEITYLQLDAHYKGYVPATAQAALMGNTKQLLPKFRGYSFERSR